MDSLSRELRSQQGAEEAQQARSCECSRLVMIGLNHRTAPIGVREKMAFGQDEVPAALRQIMSCPHVREAMLLSTCNRTELYAVVDPFYQWELPLCQLLVSTRQATVEEVSGALYRYSDLDVARHLFRVVSGLDSMVVGEVEIVAQVKDAAETAREHGAMGPVLNRLVDCALAASKRARTLTRIGKGGLSVASIAVSTARRIFGSLQPLTLLVVGAGETAELTVRHMVNKGVRRILVANRTVERARRLAEPVGGEAMGLDEFPERLAEADIVISCTEAPHPIVTREMVRRAVGDDRRRPLLVIDLAVPRDVEPGVGELVGVHLLNIDDLKQAAAENARARRAELDRAAQIVGEEAQEFGRWLAGRAAVPTIVELQRRMEEVRKAVAERFAAELESAPHDYRRLIDKYTRLLMRRLMHAPLRRLTEFACSDDAEHRLETVRELFDLATEENNG